MKKLSIILAILVMATTTHAQLPYQFGHKDITMPWQLNVGGTTAHPTHASAWLQVGGPGTSSTKGFLGPRGTAASIVNPAEGLLIYDWPSRQYKVYSQGQWVALGRTYTGADFIQNGTTLQPTANFNISGSGQLGGNLTATGTGTFAGGKVNLWAAGGVGIGDFLDANGNAHTSINANYGGNVSTGRIELNPVTTHPTAPATGTGFFYQVGGVPYYYYNGTWKPVVTGTGVDPTQFIQNGTTQQSASFNISGTGQFGGKVTFGNLVADPSGGTNGGVYYNSTANQFRGYKNGGWVPFTMAGDLIGSSIITVDKNHPNATDNRAGLSKYAVDRPFKTIQGAVSAAAATGEVISVLPGEYMEVVTITDKSVKMYMDGAILGGMIKIVTSTPHTTTFYLDGRNTSIVNNYWAGNIAIDLGGCSATIRNVIVAVSNTGGVGILESRGYSYPCSYENITFAGNTDTLILGNYNNQARVEGVKYTGNVGHPLVGLYHVGDVSNTTFTSVNECIISRNPKITLIGNRLTSSNSYGIRTEDGGNASYITTIKDNVFDTYHESVYVTQYGGSWTVNVSDNSFTVRNSSLAHAVFVQGGQAGDPGTLAFNATNKTKVNGGVFAGVKSEFNTTNGNLRANSLSAATGQIYQVTVNDQGIMSSRELIPVFTPSSSSDATGAAGDISRDDNYIYIKTSSGWKRVALSTF